MTPTIISMFNAAGKGRATNLAALLLVEVMDSEYMVMRLAAIAGSIAPPHTGQSDEVTPRFTG